jgi:hypothetical protein
VRKRTIFAALVSSLLLGFSPMAADPVIQRGIDVFATQGDGKTFYDFAENPIPAGFFCKGSKEFAGRVAFKGLPVATEPAGKLWNADTVVERLDDAVFDDKGVAVTRLQFRALSLVSTAPIKTACGAFHVYVSLNGKQRVTTMSIRRTQQGGGDFVAPLAADVRMTFIPVKPARNKGNRKLELTSSLTFDASPMPWSLLPAVTAKGMAPLTLDTDGDLTPDALLPGTSNFLAGQAPDGSWMNKGTACSCCPMEAAPLCHSDDGHLHCTTMPQCTHIANCC